MRSSMLYTGGVIQFCVDHFDRMSDDDSNLYELWYMVGVVFVMHGERDASPSHERYNYGVRGSIGTLHTMDILLNEIHNLNKTND